MGQFSKCLWMNDIKTSFSSSSCWYPLKQESVSNSQGKLRPVKQSDRVKKEKTMLKWIRTISGIKMEKKESLNTCLKANVAGVYGKRKKKLFIGDL